MENSYEIVSYDSPSWSIYDDSRYKGLRVIKDKAGRRYVETVENRVIKETPEDKFHQVQVGEKYRIDLIAHKYYRNATLWWVIADANNLNDVLYLEPGTLLRIPARKTLFGHGGVLA